MTASLGARRAFQAAVWVIRLLLAAFFAFVGYMKATASMADLDRYHAWVAHLPPGVARGVGWSELACAGCLLLPRPRGWPIGPGPTAALVLLVNQVIAIGFHAQRGELAQALPQNLLLIGLCLLVWWAGRFDGPAPAGYSQK